MIPWNTILVGSLSVSSLLESSYFQSGPLGYPNFRVKCIITKFDLNSLTLGGPLPGVTMDDFVPSSLLVTMKLRVLNRQKHTQHSTRAQCDVVDCKKIITRKQTLVVRKARSMGHLTGIVLSHNCFFHKNKSSPSSNLPIASFVGSPEESCSHHPLTILNSVHIELEKSFSSKNFSPPLPLLLTLIIQKHEQNLVAYLSI